MTGRGPVWPWLVGGVFTAAGAWSLNWAGEESWQTVGLTVLAAVFIFIGWVLDGEAAMKERMGKRLGGVDPPRGDDPPERVRAADRARNTRGTR